MINNFIGGVIASAKSKLPSDVQWVTKNI